MTRQLIVRPEAEADITDAALWYDGRERGIRLELISEVRSAIARALKNPESFTHLAGIQRSVVFSFDDFPIPSSSLFDPMQ